MNNIIKITSFFLLISVSEYTISGNYNAGKEKSQICAACHGVDGNSQIKMYPILAGQHKNYLVHALNEYRSGIRNNVIMKGFAQNLSDEDINDLSQYFSMQEGLDIPPLK
tara:strand:+ start:34184 stop:34513 length:330 start_codon:yes stop_codon:yes gene_type:complete